MMMRMTAVCLPNEKSETITELYREAECLYDAGDYRQAFCVYQKLLELDPQDALAHFNIAMMHYDSQVDTLSVDDVHKHFASAYQLFFESAVNDNNARSQMALGNIFSQKSRMVDKQALDMDDFRYDKNLCAAAIGMPVQRNRVFTVLLPLVRKRSIILITVIWTRNLRTRHLLLLGGAKIKTRIFL